MRFRLIVDGESHEVDVERRGSRLVVRVDGVPYPARASQDEKALQVRVGAIRHAVQLRAASVSVDGVAHEVVTEVPADAETVDVRRAESGTAARAEVRPPMPGRVVRLPFAPGARVKRGQPVAVLEAMKMQNEIPSPVDGVVQEVRVTLGETIGTDRVIAVIVNR